MIEATDTNLQLARERARQAGLPFVALHSHPGSADPVHPVDFMAARMLSEGVCRQFRILPVAYSEGVLTIATAEPFDELARSVAPALTGKAVRWVIATAEEIADAIDGVFRGSEPPLSGATGTVAEHPRARDEELQEQLREELPADGPPARLRLGELLVMRGIVTQEQIELRLAEQARTGERLGELLVHDGLVEEQQLLDVVADQLELPRVDLSGIDPQALPLEQIPEPVSRLLRVVPIGIDERTLYLATPDLLDEHALATLREHTDRELRIFLAEPNAIDELLARAHREAYSNTATLELLERYPEECANRVLSGAQRTVMITMALVFIAALVVFPLGTLITVIAISTVWYMLASLYKLKLTYSALGHEYEVDITDEDLAALDERDLPVYSILVPLYKEAEVVPRLIDGIDGLDYPRTKLDVRLLCEEDDAETINAIRALGLPPHYKLVIVPESMPKTKPKACNYGLLQAEGEIVVIYDAEDRPDPDQLKKAVLAFQKADPRVTCVQAKLNYFNQDQNLLTRWFSAEYSLWFDLLLPGLDAEKAPIPLGGTSNHFITERLVMLAGWDPFNVTEDADLGIRLHKAGYQTAIIDSTTLEEANSHLPNWIRQRSRWIKGYIQTWLVHMRHPLRLLRQLGPRGFLSFQLMVGGSFVVFLLNPIFWFLTTVFFLTEVGVIQQLFPSFIFYLAATELFIGNFVFLYVNLAGLMERGYFELIKYALLTPVYWGLMSIGAWKGLIQLFTNPFYWEKTEHGLDSTAGPSLQGH
ncbi:MAG TPA: glycosyltransferase [Solirubrobacteraceae bacterium]|nr:glycosyltransferase [Solirubrobacteraceae bacterium]